MLSSMILAFALSVAGSEGKDDAAKPQQYTIDMTGTSKEVQAGKSGMFRLHIKPADGYKVSAEAPLKIGLAAEGLELHKKTLGHDDAKDKKSTAPEFLVNFGAREAGDKTIAVDAMFFVCSEKICERKI